MICDGKHCKKKIKNFLTVVKGRYLCRACIKAEDIKLTAGTYKRVKLCTHCHIHEAIDCNENICTECYNRLKSNRCVRFVDEDEKNEDDKKPLIEPKRPRKPLPEVPKKLTESPKPTAVVVWPFKGRNDIELSLEKDTVVTIEEKLTQDWWYVSCGDKKGYFPSTYLEEQSVIE
jgi:copper chaperone CopZ